MIKPKDLKIRILVILGIVVLSILYIFPFKEKINLGLDLKGGMYLVLKVDTSKVPAEKVNEAAQVALEIIRNRVDEFGVKEPVIQPQGKDSILVQLPGEVDRERALNLIGKVAFLEFKLVEEDEEKLKKALEGKVPPGYQLKYLNDKPLLLEEKAKVTGTDLATAQSDFDANMFPLVTLKFNSQGTKKFAKLTRENVGKRLAIVLDGQVKSAPVIREPILGGDAQITGDFSVQEAQDLALVLRAGALPCPLKIEEEKTVGPLLGSDSVRRGLNSIILGAGLVVVFMIVYYLLGGLVALICIFLDLLFILGGLSLLRATLTLPGIAGMILTLGMAVDANVLIFERIREELKVKKPLSLAVKNGFDRAKRTIFDANITTLIAAIFLFIYGTGPIRGFATTLSLGIIASVFTSVFIGRTIFSIFLNRGLKDFRMFEFLKSPNINFIGLRNIALLSSLILIIFGFINFHSRGDQIWGIDFRGGQVLEYKLWPPVPIGKVREVLTQSGLEQLSLQEFKDIPGGIIIKSKEDITRPLQKVLKDNFEQVTSLGVNTIGPAVGAILRRKAYLAVSLSLLGILIYIAFRFKHFDFALAAVFALFHDVLISIGFVSIFGYEITLLTVTALLTIAGYSVNDTIVIYDRIRELAPKLYKLPLKEVINRAINQTLSRTIITSFTTIFVVICIFILGGLPLRGFSFTLLVGFIAGTYSSIYIASPLVLLFRRAHLSTK
jgi:SecD/SecF fusion protein